MPVDVLTAIRLETAIAERCWSEGAVIQKTAESGSSVLDCVYEILAWAAAAVWRLDPELAGRVTDDDLHHPVI